MDRNLNDEFKELTKTVVGPQLKSLGFKKSNLNFNRDVNGLVQCLNIQKSQWNNYEGIRFTMNIGLYNERIFEVSKNKLKQTKFVYDNDCFAWVRTGHLIYGHDYWYELALETPCELLKRQIENDFINAINPLYSTIESVNSLIKILRISMTENRPFHLIADIDDIAILEIEFGEFGIGEQILIDRYNKAIIPKSVQSKTVYPDGREEVRWSEYSVNTFEVAKLKRIAELYKIQL